MSRPSTDLTVLVTTADGVTKTLDSHAPDPADRPTGIQFATQIQSGFYTGGWNLRRQIDRDNEDLQILDEVRFVGASGDVAYEGYVSALPRSVNETTHDLGVATSGWMAHAADEPFTEVYVDRDFAAWGPMSRARRATTLGIPAIPEDPSVAPDPTSGSAALSLSIQAPRARHLGLAVYDAGPGLRVKSLVYTVARTNVATGFELLIYSGSTDTQLADGTANIATGAASSSSTYTPATARRFVTITLDNGSVLDALPHETLWTTLTVLGDHGVPHIGAAGAVDGVAASEVIKHLARRYCPMLNTAGVKATTYPIGHLVFKEPTTAYDAWLKVNSFHLWTLAVWENKTLHYSPVDLTDWDWEIRHDEVGNQIGLQGDDIAGLRNGIKVQFTNVATGAPEVLHPDDFAELRDDSPSNPASEHGRRIYGQPFNVPFPTTRANALQLGRLQLAEDNQLKAPGSFTIAHHVKDRSGVYQPAWKVRAGDRIRLTSSANLSDRPRLIQETNYSHDSRSVTVSVDSTARFLEAFIDRAQTALTAANVS